MKPATVLAATLLVLPLFGCGGNRVDLDSERSAIRQRDLDWAAAAGEGKDLDRIVSYWSDDAIVLPPGEPAVSGKPAIRDFMARSLQTPGFRVSWEPIQISLSPRASMAYMFEKYQITLDDSTGTARTTYGKGLSVWRKDADGTWRCVASAWNVDPQIPSEEPAP
ncbi:MAG: YybH family protein [Hyphomicrobiales bacterium]